jgi:hypothetical protein
MLQFIVLGLIPGTHLQITFGWLLGFALGVFGFRIVFQKHQQILTFLKLRFALRLGFRPKKIASKPSA